jgi:imidazolonepropionase
VRGEKRYGLDTETELRMLRVIRRLGGEQPVELVATFMAAHEVPPEYRGRQSEFVRLIIDEMIPQAAPLAEWCDVFCDHRLLHARRVTRDSLRPARAPA